jgi:ferredoxin
MKYSDVELLVGEVADFPADNSPNVCPVDAIKWPYESDAPFIESSSCIGCGLCAIRCPVQAIRLDEEYMAQINDEPNKYFILEKSNKQNNEQQGLADKFKSIIVSDPIKKESNLLFENIYKRICGPGNQMEGNDPNFLVRNFLIELGVNVGMRRRGDTNVRMDLILGSEGGLIGTGEVVLGEGIMDGPRNILDNIAVLSARYEEQKEKIIPVIFHCCLPNFRSEYWQVVKDISDILVIKINSITIGMLLLLLWNHCTLKLEEIKYYYADIDESSLRCQLENKLNRRINLSKGFLGIIEPVK